MSAETKDRVEIVLEHLSVVRVQPGDTLVFRTPYLLSEDAVDALRRTMRSAFGEDMRYLVLQDGMEMAVVRQGGPTPLPFPPPDEGGR